MGCYLSRIANLFRLALRLRAFSSPKGMGHPTLLAGRLSTPHSCVPIHFNWTRFPTLPYYLILMPRPRVHSRSQMNRQSLQLLRIVYGGHNIPIGNYFQITLIGGPSNPVISWRQSYVVWGRSRGPPCLSGTPPTLPKVEDSRKT